MEETDKSAVPSRTRTVTKALAVVVLTGGAALCLNRHGMNYPQTASLAAFIMIIAAAFLFWQVHLPAAFIAIAGLLSLDVLDINRLVADSKIDVILFLTSMMIIVGSLRDLGLFSWIIISIISIERLSARLFVFIFCLLGAVMSCIVDEVVSIVFIATLIFQVCDALVVRPAPFVIMAVMAVNIGSAGTMLGNPVGILIGQNATPPLSFADFMTWSFPIMIIELAAVIVYLQWSFRREIGEMNDALNRRRQQGLTLGPIMAVPHRRGLFILLVLVVMLSVHSLLERLFGLAPNALLIATPLLISGLLMLWRRERIHKHLEQDVEWSTLLFFMMLFVVSGTLESTGVTSMLADGFVSTFGRESGVLTPVVLSVSALGSAVIENIVFVAAFMPVVVQLDQTQLLWALLHGACLGGNITMIGSTANITAIGMMEKRYWNRMSFFTWLRTGVAVGVISCLVAWGCLRALTPYMPTHAERVDAVQKSAPRGK